MALTTLAAAACAYAVPAPTAEPAPALAQLSVVKLDGSELPLGAWLGRPAVLNIWATWCPPCRTEMPSLSRLGEMLKADGIRVAALSVDMDHNLVREFVLKYEITMPVAIARQPDAAMAALDVTALPLTLYVGADGAIVGRHLGQRDWSSQDAVTDVRAHLRPVTKAHR